MQSASYVYRRGASEEIKRVAIKVTAREAGASPAAVFIVLANRARSVQRMQKKMTAVARSLGYRLFVETRGSVGDSTKLAALVAGRTVVAFDAIFPVRS